MIAFSFFNREEEEEDMTETLEATASECARRARQVEEKSTATHHSTVCEELHIMALTNVSHTVERSCINQRELRNTTAALAALLANEPRTR